MTSIGVNSRSRGPGRSHWRYPIRWWRSTPAITPVRPATRRGRIDAHSSFETDICAEPDWKSRLDEDALGGAASGDGQAGVREAGQECDPGSTAGSLIGTRDVNEIGHDESPWVGSCDHPEVFHQPKLESRPDPGRAVRSRAIARTIDRRGKGGSLLRSTWSFCRRTRGRACNGCR